jgi:hypothetical protein
MKVGIDDNGPAPLSHPEERDPRSLYGGRRCVTLDPFLRFVG